MCTPERPDLKAALTNIRRPMPLSRKLLLVLRNMAVKILRLKTCCGNHGQPGC